MAEFFYNQDNNYITSNSLGYSYQSDNNLLKVKQKLVQFTKWFNSDARLSFYELSQKNRNERDEYIYILQSLQDNLKTTLETLLHPLQRREEVQYDCISCNEAIKLKYDNKWWTCLQNHADHLEINLSESINNPKTDNNTSPLITSTDKNTPRIESVETMPETPESPLNSFRFNFPPPNDDSFESRLYPPAVVNAVRRIDNVPDHTIQKTGTQRGACLLCCCELKNCKINKHSVTSHVMGQRHLRLAATPSSVEMLRKYHETWTGLDLPYRAHQVYFLPELGTTTFCILCKCYTKYEKLKQHIESSQHKKKVVFQLDYKSSQFYFLHLQVLVYGMTVEDREGRERSAQTNGETTNGRRRELSSNSTSQEQNDKKINHEIRLSVQNPESADVLETIPYRFAILHRQFLVQREKRKIHCTTCKVDLEGTSETVLQHITSAEHALSSHVAMPKYHYFCEICDKKLYDENGYKAHLLQQKHEKVAASRKDIFKEYECTACNVVIYGDELSLKRHLSKTLRRERSVKEIKLPDSVKKLLQTDVVLKQESEKLVKDAAAILEPPISDLMVQCCNEFEEALSEVYVRCKAHPFGSRISGLGNKDSDLDVFIDINDMYNGNKGQDAQSQVNIVKMCTQIFKKYNNKFSRVVPIPTARTPIIKIFNKSSNVYCDLSFRHGLSVENTKFLRFCLELQPIAHPFILLLKRWSFYCGLNEHITTYALAMMAIFYLQQENFLMSIKKLRQFNSDESRVIDGWPTINYTATVEEHADFVELYPNDLKTLLHNFFVYYTNFKYGTDVVCPLLGHTITKSLFLDGSQGEYLPIEMKPYIQKLKSSVETEQFRATAEMCVQDPFDLSHNLTKACSHSVMISFKTLCDLTAKHLEQI